MERFDGMHVLVLGAGMTGRSAARYLAARGARVCLADEHGGADDAPLPLEIDRIAGSFPDPSDFDLVVPSPGVPRDRYADAARAIAGDIELAGRALEVPIVAVTGTNGKSTTVRLIEALLRAGGLRAEAAGNLGRPVLDLVGRPLDVAVIEVSSFQLEAVDRFRPRVAIWLNVSPDHLDRHGDFETYCRTKARLFQQQQSDDVAILPAGDAALRAFAAPRARTWVFRSDGPLDEGAMLDGEDAVLRLDGVTRRISLRALPSGVHRDDALAALLAVVALGVDVERAAAGFLDFAALPHRLERVADRGGVAWVDDSKATNPGAATAALREVDAPVVWIAGGRDKGLSWDELTDAADGRVRTALLIGEAAETIAGALGERVACELVGDLARAVSRARDVARPGDTVLLSPACASFDQFQSFEDRGRRFRALVEASADSRIGEPH